MALKLPQAPRTDDEKEIAKFRMLLRTYLNQGISGTLTLDDGANWRIVVIVAGGLITSVTTSASVSATATWT